MRCTAAFVLQGSALGWVASLRATALATIPLTDAFTVSWAAASGLRRPWPYHRATCNKLADLINAPVGGCTPNMHM